MTDAERKYLRRKRVNRIALALSLAAMAFGVFWLVWILFETVRLGFAGLAWATFSQMTPPPNEAGGLLNAMWGSLLMVLLATFVGTPIGIMAGIFVLTLALGVTGIIVTHKLVGPAYKIKMLLRNVQTGHLKVEGSLRKGDELQDVFQAFHEMVSSLRRRQAEEVELLDAALSKAQATGTPEDVLKIFREVRDRMRAELE